MNYAILYARVSSRDQQIEGFSIPAQLKILHEYASVNNFVVMHELTDVETAKKEGRTGFNKMINLVAENKEIRHIFVEKTDRLLRNFTDYVAIERLTDFFGVKIHLVKENSILCKESRSNDKFIFGIKTLMAKNFIDNLSEEVRKGMLEKAVQGTYPSIAPWGYLNTKENGKKVISIDPVARPFIQKMFELYATGSYSLASLRKKMITDGMVYRNGKNFYVSNVEFMLKNEFYTGVFFWKGVKYESASHTPLISKELFRRVQDMLTNPHKSKSKKGLFPYTNMITCAFCGCKLTAELKKCKYIYYHCTNFKENCKKEYVRQEAIETQFDVLLGKIHITDEVQEVILQGVRDNLKDKIEYHNNLVSELKKQIQCLQQRIDQSYLDKLDQKISEDFWRINSNKWISEKEKLSVKLLATQKADFHYLENTRFILELAKNATTMFQTGNAEKKRRVLDLLISNCSYKGGNIDVELKPAFEIILDMAKTGNWCARLDSNQRPTN